jgi:bifunctional non-homologous end joining protein LigD
MAAQVVNQLPEGAEWLYELKFDGYRALLVKDGKRVEIRSRNDKNMTRLYPAVAAAGLQLKAEQVTLDGEIVAVDEHGRPSFQALQHRGSRAGHQVVFYAFDVLHLDGCDLLQEPLNRRRARLPALVEGSGLLLSQELAGTAADVVKAVKDVGLEGVVAKRRDSLYGPGERSGDWQKLKLERQQEFVVGGYRPDGSLGIDALLVGYYEGKKLLFAGKVRNGMVPHTRRELLAKLKPLHVKECPFANLPSEGDTRWGGGVSAEQMHEMQWTKPELVVQVKFVEWTAEGRLRLPKFLGVRMDKAASDVMRK